MFHDKRIKVKLSKHALCFLISFGIAIIFIFLTLTEADIPGIIALERKSRDLRFLIRGVEKPTGDVVVIAIDDRSIEMLGRWPWPRSVFAQLIFQLQEAGVRSIGFDLLFADPEENLEMQKINELIETYTQLELLDADPRNQAFFDELVVAAKNVDNDVLLAEVTQEVQNVVFAMAFVPSDSPPTDFPSFLYRSAYSVFDNVEALSDFHPVSIQGSMLPIDILAESARSLGFVNVIPDPDGSIRRGIVALEHGGALFPPLSVCVAQRHLNLEAEDLTLHIGKYLQLGPYRIPIDQGGMFNINYYGPNQTIPYYSVVDVLNGEVSDDIFKGKSVFIGGAAVGLGDLWPNPFVKSFWGVEAQATMADNILSQRFLQRPHWIKYLDAALIGIVGLFLGIALSRLQISWGIFWVVFVVFLDLAANQYAFSAHRMLLMGIYPLLAIGLATGGIFLFRYITEGRERRQMRSAFNQYLNPSVVNRVLQHPEFLKLGGEKLELTVLFSDIRSFTTISEGLSPEALVHFMNQYLTAMTEIILKHEGTLDKYIGDAIMTIFGAPEHQEDHAVRACESAIQMFEKLYDVRDSWTDEGLPEVQIGVGINTGEMVVGNMGSQRRFDYTVMGDNVNLASRLEGLSKLYGVKILVSEFTVEKVSGGFVFRELDYVRVKGREQPIKIFELNGKDYFTQGRYAYLDPFHQGLEVYRDQDWETAIKLFENVLSLKAGDKPSLVFIERCKAYKAAPPPRDWDAVYTAVQK